MGTKRSWESSRFDTYAEVAEWKFARVGWLQVTTPGASGKGSCTLAVSDIEELVAHVRSWASTPAKEAQARR